MSVRRPMGIETEYGVLRPGDPRANPVALSTAVVAAYAATTTTARWDYEGEDPLADARGFRLDRASAHPSQLTDAGAPRLAPLGPLERRREPVGGRPVASNVVLPNGARLYVDHAHPEYSSPEVMGPLDAVRWDRAGEEVMRRAAAALAAGGEDVALYKNNVDGKGQSYGTHENYLVDRAVPFGEVVRYLTPFLVTRPVFCGAGRVGIGQRSDVAGFQISQRADFVEAEVGLETTLNRPLVNTRDEPHADPGRYRRLHVIVGDATLLEVSTYLRLGTTSLLLWLLEVGEVPLELDALALADPVGETHAVSHDPGLTHRLQLADGRELTALEIQGVYLEVLTDAVGRHGADAETADVLARWGSVLARLAEDPATCAAEVEWVAKLRLLDGMRRRDGLTWDDPRLAALDLQWSDVRAERSIYGRLAAAGAVERLVTDDDVAGCVARPPQDTRAWFRGETIRRYGAGVAAAGWGSVLLDVPGAPTLARVPLPDPQVGTRDRAGATLEASADVGALVAALRAPD
ncbi:depupylase/deamidase Dop [Georgenia faecalis]|uniref:Depupylase/deamidase Dop n=2 Tax=Georgenia faecalis TaxID=2483799 RepID=A0ABV9DAE1_9MICO